ncbi:N-terminal acetyltransferase [Puccinia graminis f. sp. tritici]|uniref:N-terminal acetyltransferase n=1 Tax=Puccinia graminis f. sp. tritici TaxID=56615 RepID=A0A5B0LHA2_PUCGR|nr:N-terminal acetyltransferase [Puccinia graminis f. sp. tritici]
MMAQAESNDRLFTSNEIKEYLERIGLDQQEINALSPSEKLRTLHLNHILNVPFDTTSIHLPAKWWTMESTNTEEQAITLDRKNRKINPELVSVYCDHTFNNIIKERRGGYCWSLNSCFARLLLSLGYQVSQLPARVYNHRNQDPKEAGYSWTPLCHECLLVDTGSGKFVCDVGFGGGSSAYPIPFEENREIDTLTVGEKFKLVKEKPTDLDTSSTNQIEGYTVQRWCGKWWSPCYHFYLSPIVFKDLAIFNWHATSHPEAHFQTRMFVSLLQKDGSRRTLSCIIDDHGHQNQIKLHTRDHVGASESHVSYVQPTYAELFKTLQHEFGWGPSQINPK